MSYANGPLWQTQTSATRRHRACMNDDRWRTKIENEISHYSMRSTILQFATVLCFLCLSPSPLFAISLSLHFSTRMNFKETFYFRIISVNLTAWTIRYKNREDSSPPPNPNAQRIKGTCTSILYNSIHRLRRRRKLDNAEKTETENYGSGSDRRQQQM